MIEYDINIEQNEDKANQKKTNSLNNYIAKKI